MKRGFIMQVRNDYCQLAEGWLAAAVPHPTRENTRLHIGDTAAHYTDDIAGIAGFARPMRALAPLVGGGEAEGDRGLFLQAVRRG